jgi:hypothetical protein
MFPDMKPPKAWDGKVLAAVGNQWLLSLGLTKSSCIRNQGSSV